MEKDENNEKAPKTDIYEVGYLIVPTVSEEKVGAEVDVIKEAFNKAGGTLVSEGNPAYINLSYPMRSEGEKGGKMFDTAHFGWVKFEVSPDAIGRLDKALKDNQKILRFVLVKTVREDTFIPMAERVDTSAYASEDGEDAEGGEKKSVIKVEEKRDLTKSEEKELDEAIEELVD